MRQLQTIYDNVILVSESLQTDIDIENEAIYRPCMIISFLSQKPSKQTSKLKTKQLQTIYDNVILVLESLQTYIEIENEAITDHFW